MPSSSFLSQKHWFIRYYGAAGNLSRQCARARVCTLPIRICAGSLDVRYAVHTSTQNPSPTLTTKPNVDINSLENTLQAHRDANRARVVRKTYKKGESVRIEDPETGIPAREVRLPQKKAVYFKRIHVSPRSAFKGTSRDLDVLWRISDTEKNPPLQYRLPWLRHMDSSNLSRHTSGKERLTAEIHAFERYSCPSEEEQRAADTALQEFVDCINEIGRGLVVDVIGSRATNLADPLSDIDINVSHPSQWEVANESVEEAPFRVLNELHEAFLKSSKASSQSTTGRIGVQLYVKQARVPILLCYHKVTGLPIQVQSTPRTYDSREYVKAALREFPSLKSLFKVLKQILQMRGLTVGSSGGITSYPLLQMIVAALKFSGGKFHPTDVGNQFLFFLDFYSDIDFSRHGLSTEPLELFSKSVGRARIHDEKPKDVQGVTGLHARTHRNQDQSTFQGRVRRKLRRDKDYLMTLQDPANPVNDLGKSCYQIQDVQETFIAIRATISRAIAEWDRVSRTLGGLEQSSGIRSLLEPCVGGDYRIFEHERHDLRRVGRGSLEIPE